MSAVVIPPVPEGGLRIESHTGKQLNLRFIAAGDKYGLDWCLVHDKPSDPLVEFCGAQNAKPNGTPDQQWGNHISRYYVSTLMSGAKNGLCLDGGYREYDISKEQMDVARAWMTQRLSEGDTHAAPRTPDDPVF